MLKINFLEGGLGDNFILFLILIFIGIAFLFGCICSVISYIYNSSNNINKSSKYYWNVIWVSGLIGIMVTGMVCGAAL